ncbi:Deleted in azoospermia-like [Collichthys lucidus]|uniref:Deleted in azoospermia-like n=1 Tax=Collichthys lucidus TaxID=240159 RepID=A0A4U5VN61_COLLU|nr:Deleted in azoospermia-like [Collichthys lucidus]
MDINKPRNSNQTSPSLKLSNGYILPEGKLTPNALFVGGIDTNVNENEMRDFFARYGAVKEVKIITYRGGICKGYGFVYFSEEVNIQTIVEMYSYSNFGGVMMPQMPVNYAQNAYAYQVHAHTPDINQLCDGMQGFPTLHCCTRAPAYEMKVHSTSMDGGPEDTACQSELCGLWSPDYVDCAVVHNYSDAAYSESKCRQDDILMLRMAGSNPTPPPPPPLLPLNF